MPWLILLVSALFESVWAIALYESGGLSAPVPTAVFFAALVISMVGLGIAVRDIPIGTGYAVWTGVGATGAVGWSILTGAEQASLWKLLFLVGVVAAIVGLRLTGKSSAET